jgi:hypothetical protein
MRDHLTRLEAELRFSTATEPAPDLGALLGRPL